MAAPDVARRAAAALTAVSSDLEVFGASVVLHVRDGPRALAQSAARLHDAGLTARTAQVTEPTLDEVFLRLTEQVAA